MNMIKTTLMSAVNCRCYILQNHENAIKLIYNAIKVSINSAPSDSLNFHGH